MINIKKPFITFLKFGNIISDKEIIINNAFFNKKEIFQKVYSKCEFSKTGIEFQMTKTFKILEGEKETDLNELFFIFNMRGNSDVNLKNQNFLFQNSQILVIFSDYEESSF